jgi:hypothetical protein
VVNITGVQSYDYVGEPGNTVIELNLGALSQITSIAWNFGMTAYSPSWLADMQISFTNSSGNGVYFAPSDTEDSGSEHQSGSASPVDLCHDAAGSDCRGCFGTPPSEQLIGSDQSSPPGACARRVFF